MLRRAPRRGQLFPAGIIFFTGGRGGAVWIGLKNALLAERDLLLHIE